MEEDIKILENMIEKFKTIDEDTYEKEDLWTMCRYKHYKAIENLIARYKELEENQIWSEATIEGLKKDFIPKSKIKEKIEELEKEDKEYLINAEYFIKVLQELLEES